MKTCADVKQGRHINAPPHRTCGASCMGHAGKRRRARSPQAQEVHCVGQEGGPIVERTWQPSHTYRDRQQLAVHAKLRM
eukprot:82176-Pelagomonas_calceolata.AAC.1